ncbi:DUF3164 family protein [Burkholderiaceae bacterium UC74_6]
MNTATQAASEQAAIPKGYWQDAKGALIPEAKVKDIDKRRDSVVREAISQAKQMSAQLAQFKLAAMAAVSAFADLSAAEYGAKVGGAKGNMTLTSFDGKYKVQRAIQESIVFDERLQVAKSLIDECVHIWAKGANKNIQALVNHAFQVDQEGKVSTGRVLGLRQLEIDDEKWSRAMDAIADSMRVSGSKPYIRFYERNDATGEYLPIPLDISAA